MSIAGHAAKQGVACHAKNWYKISFGEMQQSTVVANHASQSGGLLALLPNASSMNELKHNVVKCNLLW